MNLGPNVVKNSYQYVLNQSGANPITLGDGSAVNWNADGVVVTTGNLIISGYTFKDNVNTFNLNTFSYVAGGTGNKALGAKSNVAGGESNSGNGEYSNVAGGQNNIANSFGSNVAGGTSNKAFNIVANVAGGH